MNILLNLFLGVYMFFALCLTPVLAQGVNDKWDTLNNLADKLMESGDYEQAIIVAKKALNVAEKTLGSDHPHVAESLDKLAWAHYKRGKYAQAESFSNRALAIWENAGPDYQLQHCISIKQLGLIQLETGRNREALKMLQQAQDRGGVCDRAHRVHRTEISEFSLILSQAKQENSTAQLKLKSLSDK